MGEGAKPRFSNSARMNGSRRVCGHAKARTAGGVRGFSGWNDQNLRPLGDVDLRSVRGAGATGQCEREQENHPGHSRYLVQQ
jgi:hypothetical protein